MAQENLSVNFSEKTIWGKGNLDNHSIPKIIWTFWESSEFSPLVAICQHQIQSLLPDYKIHFLNNKTLGDFIDVPVRKLDLPFANYSDLIRLKVIKKYGGIYVDASTLLTQNFDWIHQLKFIDKSEFVGFIADFFTEDFGYPLIENWFLAATMECKFISDWESEYEKCYTSENPRNFYNQEKQNPEFCHKLDGVLTNYLLPYLSAQKIVRKSQNYRLTLMPSSSSGHLYTFGLKLKPHQISEVFLRKNAKNKTLPPLVKFEKKGRASIDTDIKNGDFKQNALLFSLVKNSGYERKNLKQHVRKCWYILKNIINAIAS